MNRENAQVNRKFAIVVIAIFFVLLILPTIVWGILKVADCSGSDVMEKVDFDTGENRALADFPDEFDPKTITVELENWYNDHLPFRAVLYRTQKALEKWVETPYEEKLRPQLVAMFHGQENEEDDMLENEEITLEDNNNMLENEEIALEDDQLIDESFFPPIYRSKDVTEGRNKWLFYRGDDSEVYYTGANIRDEEWMKSDAAVLVELNELCKEKGITLQFAIYPNKEQVYSEHMPSIPVLDEYKMVERFVDYVNENTDVNIVYPLEELLEAKPNWDLYFQCDSHWNAAGAFVALQSMYEKLELETTDLTELPVKQLYGSDPDYSKYVYNDNTSLAYGPRGDLIGMGGVDPADYPESFNYVIDYRPDVEILSEVGPVDSFDVMRHTTSNGTNDLNFVMIGDSYRALMSPFLERDFTDCVLLHRSTMSASESLKAIKEADVLVLSTVERHFDWGIIQTAQSVLHILSAE